MKMTEELIRNDLYTSNDDQRSMARGNRVTYEQIYWVLFTGFGLLVGSACLLIIQL